MRVTKIELTSNNQSIHATMDYTYSENKVSKVTISVSGEDIPWSGSGSKNLGFLNISIRTIKFP